MSVSPDIEQLRNVANIFATIASDVADQIERAALHPADYKSYGRIARHLIDDRTDCEKTFGVDLHHDLGWIMLLNVYVSMTDGRRISDVALALASGAPSSTATRTINFMIANGDLVRTTRPNDRISTMMTLSDARFAAMTAYLARVAERWGLVVYDPPAFAGSRV
jgi:hypothetical protein